MVQTDVDGQYMGRPHGTGLDNELLVVLQQHTTPLGLNLITIKSDRVCLLRCLADLCLI